MINAARSGDPGAPGLVADTLALPFPDGVAGTVHCERVLQWTADPDAAVAELWRVTAPGGLLAVTDTDWATFAVDAPEGWVNDVLADAALGWVPHPRLAGTLVDRLTTLGASAVEERRDHVLISAWDPDDPAQADGPPGLLAALHRRRCRRSAGRARRARRAAAAAAPRTVAARLTIVTAVARR
jgi:SAM-dependent methyltransferase